MPFVPRSSQDSRSKGETWIRNLLPSQVQGQDQAWRGTHCQDRYEEGGPKRQMVEVKNRSSPLPCPEGGSRSLHGGGGNDTAPRIQPPLCQPVETVQPEDVSWNPNPLVDLKTLTKLQKSQNLGS